jgi:hypothetical protein
MCPLCTNYKVRIGNYHTHWFFFEDLDLIKLRNCNHGCWICKGHVYDSIIQIGFDGVEKL